MLGNAPQFVLLTVRVATAGNDNKTRATTRCGLANRLRYFPFENICFDRSIGEILPS